MENKLLERRVKVRLRRTQVTLFTPFLSATLQTRAMMQRTDGQEDHQGGGISRAGRQEAASTKIELGEQRRIVLRLFDLKGSESFTLGTLLHLGSEIKLHTFNIQIELGFATHRF